MIHATKKKVKKNQGSEYTAMFTNKDDIIGHNFETQKQMSILRWVGKQDQRQLLTKSWVKLTTFQGNLPRPKSQQKKNR